MYTKRLLSEQIRLNNFLSGWVLNESARYRREKEEDSKLKGLEASSIDQQHIVDMNDSLVLHFLT